MGEQLQGSSSAASTTKPVFARMLCAVDGKEGGYAALRQAAEMSAPGGELTVLVVTSFRRDGERRAPAIGAQDAAEIVTHAESMAAEAGLTVQIEVDPATPPAHVVLEWAAGYDLLAIGAPSASWLGGMLVSGVADSALGTLRTPVLTARPRAAGELHRDVLLADDGLDDSAAARALCAAIASAHAARLTLVHALGRVRHTAAEQIVAHADELRARGVAEPDVIMRHGFAPGVILDAAEQLRSSLIVLGSGRRSGPSALGSVSRRVVHQAACSVLTVPPHPA